MLQATNVAAYKSSFSFAFVGFKAMYLFGSHKSQGSTIFDYFSWQMSLV
jgi:hypothetical protein